MASLSELFEIDPELLTDELKHEILDKLRASRHIWTKEQGTARSRTGRASGKMPRPGKITSIDDLGEIEI